MVFTAQSESQKGDMSRRGDAISYDMFLVCSFPTDRAACYPPAMLTPECGTEISGAVRGRWANVPLPWRATTVGCTPVGEATCTVLAAVRIMESRVYHH